METLPLETLKAIYLENYSKKEQASSSFEQWLEVRERCRKDLYFLGKTILHHDLVEHTHRPVCDLFVQKDNSKSIQDQDSIRFRLLLYPRGSYKTTIDRVDAVQWHLNFPLVRIGFFSASFNFAMDELLIPTREYFVIRDTPTLFQKLFPEYCVLAEKAIQDNSWFSPVGKPTVPTFYADSIESGLSGRHFDVMKCDDCVSNRNSRTGDQLQKTIDGFNTSKPMVTSVNGYLDLIGTRYHLADLYGYFLEQFDPSEMRTIIAPAWKVLPSAATKTTAELLPEDVELLFPEGLSFKTLKREAKDQRSFACQYLNDPVAAAITSFTRELMESRTVDWKQVPTKVIYYIAWDFAYSIHKNRDYTVGAVGAVDEQGRLFVIDIFRARYQASDLAYKIAESARQYKPQLIRIENSNGADFLAGEIKRAAETLGLSNLSLDWFKNANTKGAKESRINALQAHLKAGRIYFLNTIQGLEELYKEFCEFPGGPHDDIPDAISMLQTCAPQTPTKAANAEAYNEIYKTLKRKRHLEDIFGEGSNSCYDPTVIADEVPSGPNEFSDPVDPFGLPGTERVI